MADKYTPSLVEQGPAPRRALDGTVLRPYPGDFIYGVDLNNGYPCWNLSLSGTLDSPDFVAAINRRVYECHKPVRDMSLDLIERGNVRGAYTLRGVWFVQEAAVSRPLITSVRRNIGHILW